MLYHWHIEQGSDVTDSLHILLGLVCPFGRHVSISENSFCLLLNFQWWLTHDSSQFFHELEQTQQQCTYIDRSARCNYTISICAEKSIKRAFRRFVETSDWTTWNAIDSREEAKRTSNRYGQKERQRAEWNARKVEVGSQRRDCHFEIKGMSETSSES